MRLTGHRIASPPFACSDGRIFDVIDIVVQEGGKAPFERRCIIEIQQRQCDDQYPEFDFHLFSSAFEKGICGPTAREIVDYALNWVCIWLESHPAVPHAYRQGRPLIVECR